MAFFFGWCLRFFTPVAFPLVGFRGVERALVRRVVGVDFGPMNSALVTSQVSRTARIMLQAKASASAMGVSIKALFARKINAAAIRTAVLPEPVGIETIAGSLRIEKCDANA